MTKNNTDIDKKIKGMLKDTTPPAWLANSTPPDWLMAENLAKTYPHHENRADNIKSWLGKIGLPAMPTALVAGMVFSVMMGIIGGGASDVIQTFSDQKSMTELAVNAPDSFNTIESYWQILPISPQDL